MVWFSKALSVIPWSLVWRVIRPILPYLAVAGAVYGSWWYVTSLHASVGALRADLAKAEQHARQAEDQLSARLRAQKKAEENERETTRFLARGRAAVPVVAASLREYRLPARTNPDQPADTRISEPAGCAPTAATEDRSAEIERVCAEVSGDLQAFKREILRLNGALEKHKSP